MSIGPENAPTVPFEGEVVQEAEEGLEEEQDENNDANDGMSAVHKSEMGSHIDPNCRGRDVKDKCNDLEEAVDDP